MNLLTSSRLRAYRTCARYHHLRYVEGWSPVREQEALRVGSAVHLGLEAWWECDVPLDAFESAMGAVRGVGIDAYEQVRIEEMLRGYDRHWLGDRLRFKTIAVEQSFRAPLLNPETMHASRTWALAGKVDAIARDLETGKTVVVEHKTCSEDIQDAACDYWAKLSMDHQCSAYVLGAEALGHQVDEILYDVIRKPGIRPKRATPPESRKFKKRRPAKDAVPERVIKSGPRKGEVVPGSLGDPGEMHLPEDHPSLLHANQRLEDETPDEYRIRVREDIKARPERYFQRRQVMRSNSQLRDFLFDAWQQAKQMHDAERLNRAPRNPEACHRFGKCWAWDICANGLDPSGTPDMFVRLDDVHPELKEVDTNDTDSKPAEWWKDDASERAEGSPAGA